MIRKQRSPLQVSDKFLENLKNLQKNIRMKTGDEKSLRQITDEIANSGVLNDIDKIISQKGDFNMDVKIKFDRRRL